LHESRFENIVSNFAPDLPRGEGFEFRCGPDDPTASLLFSSTPFGRRSQKGAFYWFRRHLREFKARITIVILDDIVRK
jgi:hypothetical protein